MTGFLNISVNNGWAMAATGAVIVFLGLVTLALVISQLHRLLSLFEKPARSAPRHHATGEEPAVSAAGLPPLDELKMIYRPLAEQLGDCFELAQLYQLSRKNDLPHPHLSIRQLREAHLLLPNDKGQFCWNPF